MCVQDLVPEIEERGGQVTNLDLIVILGVSQDKYSGVLG